MLNRCGAALVLAALGACWPLAAAEDTIRLIIRGDDLGMTQGSLAGFEKAFNEGILTCGSIIVPGPWLEGAAALAQKNPGWCLGIHLALVGEWRGYRWRPVLPWDQVKSLVDEDGFFYTYPGELFAHKPKLEEMEAELRAQVALARKKGIRVQYLDTHYMEQDSYPGLDAMIRKMGRDYNLPVATTLGEEEISLFDTLPAQKKADALTKLSKLTPGLWYWVLHPAIDSPEQQALIHTRPEDIYFRSTVASDRAAELEVLLSTEVRSMLLHKRIQLITYQDAWKH